MNHLTAPRTSDHLTGSYPLLVDQLIELYVVYKQIYYLQIISTVMATVADNGSICR